MSNGTTTPPYDSTVEQLYHAANDVEMQVCPVRRIWLSPIIHERTFTAPFETGCVSHRQTVPIHRHRHERPHRLLRHHRAVLRRCRESPVPNHDHHPQRRPRRAGRVSAICVSVKYEMRPRLNRWWPFEYAGSKTVRNCSGSRARRRHGCSRK